MPGSDWSGGQFGEDEICAVCAGCGDVARGEFYVSEMPDGETLYWSSLCTHEYEVGGEITCRCGMLCPRCQDPADLEAQLEALRASREARSRRRFD